MIRPNLLLVLTLVAPTACDNLEDGTDPNEATGVRDQALVVNSACAPPTQIPNQILCSPCGTLTTPSPTLTFPQDGQFVRAQEGSTLPFVYCPDYIWQMWDEFAGRSDCSAWSLLNLQVYRSNAVGDRVGPPVLIENGFVEDGRMDDGLGPLTEADEGWYLAVYVFGVTQTPDDEFLEVLFHVSVAPEDSADPVAPPPASSVIRSGVYSPSYEGINAFDGTGSMWLSNMRTSSVYVGRRLPDGYTQSNWLTGYRIRYTNGNCCTQRAPRDFRLEASTNGLGWTTLHSVTNQTGWTSGETREFELPTTPPPIYQWFRLRVTRDNYNFADPITLVSIGELELLGCPIPL